MPRQVDHALRREQLAAAAWRVARRNGVGALSVRAVGEEAGWTSGVVQHYFPKKHDLLRHAFELVQQRTVNRIHAIAAEESPDLALEATIMTLLPLDPDIEAESEVWFAFLGLALGDAELRETAQHGHREMLEVVTRQVERAADAGALRSGLDAEAVAGELLALADGLNVQALFRSRGADADELQATVVRRLADLAATGPRTG